MDGTHVASSARSTALVLRRSLSRLRWRTHESVVIRAGIHGGVSRVCKFSVRVYRLHLLGRADVDYYRVRSADGLSWEPRAPLTSVNSPYRKLRLSLIHISEPTR